MFDLWNSWEKTSLSVEKRKITPPQDIWKFPFTLQIAFIHRFDEKEDKIDGDYEGSKVYISLLGKSYRENVLFILTGDRMLLSKNTDPARTESGSFKFSLQPCSKFDDSKAYCQ